MSVALWSLSSVGCRGCSDAPSVEAGEDASPRRVCRPLAVPDGGPPQGAEGLTDLYVITSLRFGEVDDGLNLDCLRTPHECRDDACRDGPDDGRGGADNRLGPLALKLSSMAGSDLQREMSRAVESGRHPLLLRIVDATDRRQGRARAVELSFGLNASEGTDELFSGRGRVRPDPEGPSERPSRFEPAAIEDGVVRAGPTRDWMPLFWTRGEIAAVPVEAAYLRFRVDSSRGGEKSPRRITEGLLAGAITPAALSEAVLDMDGRTAKVLGRLGPIVRALVRQQADLDRIPEGPTERECRRSRDCPVGLTCRRGRCHEPAGRFDAISFGVSFEAVSVRYETPPLESR